MRKLSLSLLLGLFAMTATAQQVTVNVKNNTGQQRQELVEVDAKTVYKKLGVSAGRNFRVINAVRQEVIYQITYDGKILIDASVRPHGTATYTIVKGTPRDAKVFVSGRQYPERVDDIAWENDRGAYRLYGPALQKSGERAFGNDVWVKNTPDLEVEKRYKVELENHPAIQQLKKAGKDEEALALEEATTYHFDHGYGLDCYKVGPSLGCGAPALMDGADIIFPYCYKDYQILDNGPLRFTVSLTYHPTDYQGQKLTEHRLLSLDKGSNFNRQTVWYEGAKKGIDVASGVVIHNEDTNSAVLGKNFVQYADPTDNPNGQNFQIYVGVIFPNGASETRQVENAGHANGIFGHALCIKRNVKPGEKLTYYWGSAWSKFDCRTQDEWQLRIDNFQKALKQPLAVTVE
ncbi:MAG: DUF4861 domain-containing protein [Prevotella sp.]|nr:DUF4861 domain-containing protein [Prevotella sp.]